MSMNPPEKMEDLQVNRENKRKQYEKGYYKKHPCNESFVCKNCGRPVVPEVQAVIIEIIVLIVFTAYTWI